MKTQLTTLVVLASIASMAVAAPQQDMKKDGMDMKMMNVSMTSAFKGVEVNGGTANLYKKGNEWHLRFSDDFKTPTSPSPHWQVVDGDGNTFLLQRITIAGDKANRDITLPKYIHSVKNVQVWCSFAEVVLGEASFGKTVRLK